MLTSQLKLYPASLSMNTGNDKEKWSDEIPFVKESMDYIVCTLFIPGDLLTF